MKKFIRQRKMCKMPKIIVQLAEDPERFCCSSVALDLL